MPLFNHEHLTRSRYSVEQLEIRKLFGEARLAALKGSRESFSASMLKAVDKVASLFNTARVSFVRISEFMAAQKRSEICKYSDDHVFELTKVEGLSLSDVEGLRMDRPTGMKDTMLKGVDATNKLYEGLNLVEYAQTFDAHLKSLIQKLSRNDSSFNFELKDYGIAEFQMSNAMEKDIAAYYAIFTEARTQESAPFLQVYKTMEDFKSCRFKLQNMEFRLKQSDDLVKLIDTVNDDLSAVTAFLENAPTIKQKFVKDMADAVNHLAACFDLYGVLVHRQMTLEHNHCRNCITLAGIL